MRLSESSKNDLFVNQSQNLWMKERVIHINQERKGYKWSASWQSRRLNKWNKKKPLVHPKRKRLFYEAELSTTKRSEVKMFVSSSGVWPRQSWDTGIRSSTTWNPIDVTSRGRSYSSWLVCSINPISVARRSVLRSWQVRTLAWFKCWLHEAKWWLQPDKGTPVQ